MKCDHAIIAADTPSVASNAHENDPVMTPSAKMIAARRPWVDAIDMIARLLGPGLAVPMKYAV